MKTLKIILLTLILSLTSAFSVYAADKDGAITIEDKSSVREVVYSEGITGEKIILAPVAKISWDELVSMEAAKPLIEEEVPRIAPFMPMPPAEEIGSIDKQPSPSEALLAPKESFSTTTTPPYITNFQALPDNNTTIPPDTHGAVGKYQVMTMLNSQVRIQSRSGTIISTVSLSTFWAPAGGSDEFDPHLIYDQSVDRWMAVCDSDRRSAASSVLFAISDTDDPTGNWTFYRIDADPTNINWSDFPDIGFNNTWITITNNMFTVASDGWSGVAMWVIDKSTALAGGALTITFFPTGFDTAGGVWGFSLRVCQTFGSEPRLYLVDNSGFTLGGIHAIRISEITGTASLPVWSPTAIADGLFVVTNDFSGTQIDASQLGTSARIATNDIRMLNAVYRNGHI